MTDTETHRDTPEPVPAEEPAEEPVHEGPTGPAPDDDPAPGE